MNQRAIAGLAAGIALVLGVVGALYIAPPTTDSAVATEYLSQYPAPRELPDFSLTNHNGETFTKQDLKGKWSLVFLGYTYCPDICPTTMASLSRIYPQLAALEGNAPVQVLFISVDPKRDTPERLAEYIGFFNPNFLAVTGGHEQLFPLVRGMGMMYAMSESTNDANYLVDHSGSITVVNPQAQAIGRFKPVHEPGVPPISDAQQILADMPDLVER